MSARAKNTPPPSAADANRNPVPSRWMQPYRKLLRLRDRLLAEEEELRKETSGLLAQEVADFGDGGNNRTERTILEAELRTEQNLLDEVEAALERIRGGSYGFCEVTGLPIEPARLRAVPWTRYNRATAERLEARRPASSPKRK